MKIKPGLNIKPGLSIKIWDIAHMGQAHMGPGPIWALGPGPFLVGRTPHQKTHPGKKSPNCVFCCFLKTKKMRDVRTIIWAAVSRRDLCYVSENKGLRFAKNKLIHAESSFIAHRSRAHFCFMKFIPINVLVPYKIWYAKHQVLFKTWELRAPAACGAFFRPKKTVYLKPRNCGRQLPAAPFFRPPKILFI